MKPDEVCEQDQSEHLIQNCSQKGSQQGECNLTWENREPEDEGPSRLGLGQPGAAVGIIQLTWTSEQAQPGHRSPLAVGRRFPEHVEDTCEGKRRGWGYRRI